MGYHKKEKGKNLCNIIKKGGKEEGGGRGGGDSILVGGIGVGGRGSSNCA